MAVKLIYPRALCLFNCRNCRFKERRYIKYGKNNPFSKIITCLLKMDTGKHIDTGCRRWACPWPGKIIEQNHIEKWYLIEYNGKTWKINPYGKVIE